MKGGNDVSENIFKEALLLLEKIARETGEEEEEVIFELKEEHGVTIGEKEIRGLTSGKIFIMIIRPFNVKSYRIKKKNLESELSEVLTEKFTDTIKINGRLYFKCPEIVEQWCAYEEIFERMKATLGEDYYKLTGEQWAELEQKKEWRQALVQIAREIIAQKIVIEKNW